MQPRHLAPEAQVELLRRQFLQLVDPKQLPLPPPSTIKAPEIQARIYATMFRADGTQGGAHLPRQQHAVSQAEPGPTPGSFRDPGPAQIREGRFSGLPAPPLPPAHYRLPVLKRILAAIEQAMTDPDEDVSAALRCFLCLAQWAPLPRPPHAQRCFPRDLPRRAPPARPAPSLISLL